MKSLTYLNSYGQTSVTVTDNRPATVIFNRVPPLKPINQISTVTTTSLGVQPGIDIVEIIQGATADVRYQVKIITGGSPTLSSSIVFPTLPTGVSQSIVGSTYTLSGIDTVDKWNTIKSFTWMLASNWASCPLWYLEVSIIYYDEASDADKTVSWLVYDELHFWIAQLESTTSITADVFKVKQVTADITSSSTMSVVGLKIKGGVAELSSSFSITANGGIVVSSMYSTVSLHALPKYNYRGRASLSTAFTLVVGPTYTYTNDLRFQVYHDGVTKTDVGLRLNALAGSTFIVYWGDGTNSTGSTTTGTTTITLTKTYSGTGYKDIKVVQTAGAWFRMSFTPKPYTNNASCYTYKIHNWGTNFHQSSSYTTWQEQIYLTNIPNYIPVLDGTTSLVRMFSGCTSLNDPNISSWDMSAVTDLYGMFINCTSFNQPVPWTLTNCKYIGYVFDGCTAFNQPLNWTLTNLIEYTGSNSAGYVLRNCVNFDQDLSTFTIGPNPIKMIGFMLGATSFSNINYNKFLIQLANCVYSYRGINGVNGSPYNVPLQFPTGLTTTTTVYGSGHYKTGASAYTYLVNSMGWTIWDGVDPTISISGGSVVEGNALPFTITLSKKSINEVFSYISINTSAGTATQGNIVTSLNDYENKIYSDAALTLPITYFSIPAGSTTKTVYVKTYNNDLVSEGAVGSYETVVVEITGMENATAGTISASGQIYED